MHLHGGQPPEWLILAARIAAYHSLACALTTAGQQLLLRQDRPRRSYKRHSRYPSPACCHHHMAMGLQGPESRGERPKFLIGKYFAVVEWVIREAAHLSQKRCSADGGSRRDLFHAH